MVTPLQEVNCKQGKQGGSDGAAQAVLDPQATQVFYSTSVIYLQCVGQSALLLCCSLDMMLSVLSVKLVACCLGHVVCVCVCAVTYCCVSCNLILKLKPTVVLVCSAYTVLMESSDRLCQH